jgi:hypothetical protein
MHTRLVEQAQQSVVAVHDLILEIFTNGSGEGSAAIDRLMPAFADSFTMITISGALVDRAQVEQMFRGAIGAKPGMEIRIGKMEAIWQETSSVAIRYEETHRLNGIETSRMSVAIMSIDADSVRWQHLQETSLTKITA